MFSNLKDWIIGTFLKRWVATWFAALTLPGKKRILGAIIFALATAAAHYPEFATQLKMVTDFLQTLGPEQYQDVGLVTFVVGVLDWLRRKYKTIDVTPGAPEVPTLRVIERE